MHRYADLIGESSRERGGIRSVWILLWLLITGIAIVTLWVRLRSPTPEAPSLDDDE
jgi:hypothetical protein